MQPERPITLKEICSECLQKIKNHEPMTEFEAVCVYTTPEVYAHHEFSLSDICWISQQVDVDDHFKEIFPPFVETKGLFLYCTGLDLYAVICNMLEQKPTANCEDILRGLNYFAVHDSYISLQDQQLSRLELGIFPAMPLETMTEELENRRSRFKEKNLIFSYPAGVVLAGISANNACLTLCDLISHRSTWALYISLYADKWMHSLYQNGIPVSPRKHQCDMSMKNHFRLEAQIPFFQECFPFANPRTLESYLMSDHAIVLHQEQWERYRRKKGRSLEQEERVPYYVLPDDRYRSDDPRQVFDLLRYLSFPLEDEPLLKERSWR